MTQDPDISSTYESQEYEMLHTGCMDTHPRLEDTWIYTIVPVELALRILGPRQLHILTPRVMI